MTVRNYYAPGLDKTLWYTPDEAYDRSHLAGKVILITGPTAGLGAACIDEMCGFENKHRPSKVILVGRNPSKLEKTAAQLESADIKSSSYVSDMLLPKTVFQVCREIIAAEPSLHIACLNAGAFLTHPEGRMLQEDGLEEHYCCNFLQMAIFIEELAPLLSKTSTTECKGRICVMGSYTTMAFAKGKLDIEHLNTKKGPHHSKTFMKPGDLVYAQSKLMQHVYCKFMYTRIPSNVTLNVACPGAAPSDTPGWGGLSQMYLYDQILFPILSRIAGFKRLSEGCATMMHLIGAKSMEAVSGKFCDFGYKYRSHSLNKPTDLEVFPSENYAIAESIANETVCTELANDTHKVIKQLRSKYEQYIDVSHSIRG
eukprot:CAMPEP_0194399006 /NCGR_PEP_ID=MMETSP0174-20130528/126419_1 /TAXON_ID=216777 /ORGANISM="Proboscia alata, Strain PI-D3" /LENGTH=368 /DNA_ID=CAMNT_0039195365 /DNA_START=46 /DNA_END=1148 /DNA_ORIENTATION=-